VKKTMFVTLAALTLGGAAFAGWKLTRRNGARALPRRAA
jgi:hypothetical protein